MTRPIREEWLADCVSGARLYIYSTNGIMKNLTLSLPPLRSAKLLDQMRERIRYLHYSLRTEEVYVYWARFFIRFHRLRHPAEMGATEVGQFLGWPG